LIGEEKEELAKGVVMTYFGLSSVGRGVGVKRERRSSSTGNEGREGAGKEGCKPVAEGWR
jgi:hypothetical protein